MQQWAPKGAKNGRPLQVGLGDISSAGPKWRRLFSLPLLVTILRPTGEARRQPVCRLAPLLGAAEWPNSGLSVSVCVRPTLAGRLGPVGRQPSAGESSILLFDFSHERKERPPNATAVRPPSLSLSLCALCARLRNSSGPGGAHFRWTILSVCVPRKRVHLAGLFLGRVCLSYGRPSGIPASGAELCYEFEFELQFEFWAGRWKFKFYLAPLAYFALLSSRGA